MTTATIPIIDEHQWLAERAKDVTSTEVAALFHRSPYMTEFELWHAKAKNIVVEHVDNDRTRWGRRLQDVIAAGVAEDHGWEVEPMRVYKRVEGLRLGSSFDFLVTKSEHGTGLMEIKNVDRAVFASEWYRHDDGYEAPVHIELQVQTEMEVADLGWCAIVALVGGNDAKVVIRQRDRAIGQKIRAAVAAFWTSIAEGRAPKPTFPQDAEFMIDRLYASAIDGKVAMADAETDALVARYAEAHAAESAAAAVKMEMRARILERVQDASRVRSAHGTVSCGQVAPNEGTLITPEMVGQRFGCRSGFRSFRFTPKKEKQS